MAILSEALIISFSTIIPLSFLIGGLLIIKEEK